MASAPNDFDLSMLTDREWLEVDAEIGIPEV